MMEMSKQSTDPPRCLGLVKIESASKRIQVRRCRQINHYHRSAVGELSKCRKWTRNRPFAARPLRDLIFTKLWAITQQMEMEKAC